MSSGPPLASSLSLDEHVTQVLLTTLQTFRAQRIDPTDPESLHSALEHHPSFLTPRSSPPPGPPPFEPELSIDWSSSAFLGLAFDRPFEERAIIALTEHFEQYALNDGALDMESDDEDDEQDEGEEPTNRPVEGKLFYCTINRLLH